MEKVQSVSSGYGASNSNPTGVRDKCKCQDEVKKQLERN